MLYKIITLHGNLLKKTISLSYVHIEENGGQWNATLQHYKQSPIAFLSTIPQLLQMPIEGFVNINNDVNNKLVAEITQFIKENELEHKIDFISNNGISITNDLFFENNAIFAANLNLPIIGQYNSSYNAMQGSKNAFAIANILLQIDSLLNDNNFCIALALMGALRWRESYNILAQQSGVSKNVIAGCIWQGSEA